MNEIKCPNCGEEFSIDENYYNKIVKQIRDPLNFSIKKYKKITFITTGIKKEGILSYPHKYKANVNN